jgi:peptidoglycan/LPS O-acetylase OafA/YrhL
MFRLLLALAVVVNHMTTLQSGLAAVLLFFVLSGYWVADLWDKTPQPHRLATFYLNRFLRIWPLYLAVMLICAAIRHHVPGFSEVFLLGAASRPFPHLIGTEWSLDIEIQFYILLPLLAPLMARTPNALLAVLLAAIAWAGWRFETATGIITIAKFIPAFAVGMWLQRSKWVPDDRTAALSLYLFAALAIAQMWLWELQGPVMHALFRGWDDDALAAVWVAPLLPYVAASMHRPSDADDRRRGDLSYPLYLAHLPVLIVAQEIYNWRTLSGAIVLFALMTVFALAIWLGIDRPAERFRRALLASRPFARRYGKPASS